MKRPGTAVGGPPQLPRYTHDRGLGAKARSYLEQPPMSISEPFIRRPIATSLLMLGVLVFGIGAFNLLPVAAVPNVDFPTITVTAQYPGANPSTMASAVATPLEQQFISIPSLSEMTSWSGVGVSSITLQFDLNRNIDAAAGDVQQAINAASGLLPKDMPTPPTYRKVNPANFAILIYAIHSDDLPPYEVDQYATNVIADRLSTEPGVGQVFVFGSMPYAARVQINPASLAAKGLGLEDVRNALVAATVNGPKGEIEGDQQAIALDTNDQLFKAAQYGNIIIAYKNGAPVHIKDVGDVINSVQNEAAPLMVRRPAGRRHRHPEGARRQHGRRGGPHQSADAEARAVAAALGPCRPDVRPLADDASGDQRRAIDHAADDHPRRRRNLPVPADVVGDGDPEPGGAAVAARDLRRDVCRPATASTTSR